MKLCSKCGTQIPDDSMVCPQCQTPINNQQEPIENQQHSTPKNKNNIFTIAIHTHIYPIIIGAILILVGIFIQVPGGALTTYGYLDGDYTSAYKFDDKYSSIDEYVGGDAYNYIIGATLVAGKISGTMTMKAIFIVGGFLCICLGIILKFIQEKRVVAEISIPDNTENVEIENKPN